MTKSVKRRVWFCALVAFIALAVFAMDLYRFANSPFIQAESQRDFYLKPGLGMQALGHDLVRAGLIKSHQRHYLRLLIELNRDTYRLKAGEYRIMPGMTPLDFLNELVAGKVVYRRLTIIDGWTFKQLRLSLEDNPYLENDLSNESNNALIKLLDLKHHSLEGMFFPDTYTYTRGSSALSILAWAHQEMMHRLKTLWQHRATDLPYKTPYQALTAASLIEKETALPSEAPQISGVIVRRLQKRMRLQFDPTVIFSLGDKYNGKLSKKDLRTASPYNTYTTYGLPPGPIALPGENALYAAMHPDDSDNLYFVATGNGGHTFSATLQTHNKAVKRYIAHLRRTQASSRPKGLPYAPFKLDKFPTVIQGCYYSKALCAIVRTLGE